MVSFPICMHKNLCLWRLFLQLETQFPDLGRLGTTNMPVKSPSTASPCCYPELPEGNWTRLLTLLPGKKSDPLACELFSVDVNNAPTFEAISYVWGDPHNAKPIICSQATLFITINLFNILQTLRHSQDVRLVWADAICIDQGDVKERNHQVGIMGMIYSRASRVIVWLGQDDHGDARYAFDLISKTNRHFEDGVAKFGTLEDVPPPSAKTGVLDCASWAPVRRLFALDWFSRVWVLQEVGLAASAIVLYGAHSINWSDIVEIVLLWQDHPDLQAAANLFIGRMSDAFKFLWSTYGSAKSWKTELPFIQRAANEPDKKEMSHFFNVLRCGIRFKASLGSDNIYAFLGHPAARSGMNPIVNVDYNRSTSDLCKEVAIRLLQQMNSLAVLSAVYQPGQPNSIAPLSWVPRWDQYRDVLMLHSYPGCARFFDASLSNNLPTEFAELYQPPFQVVNDELRVRGIIIDDVQSSSPPFSSYDMLYPTGTKNHTGPLINPLEVVLADLFAEAFPPSSRYTNSIEACRLTLIAGLNWASMDAELDLASLEADFRACVAEKCRPDILSRVCQTPVNGPPKGKRGSAARFLQAVRMYTHNRRFFVTHSGYYGLGPLALQQGDVCCVLLGAVVPFILRRSQVKSQYKLVGECFIQGIMRGEAISSCEKDSQKVEELSIL